MRKRNLIVDGVNYKYQIGSRFVMVTDSNGESFRIPNDELVDLNEMGIQILPSHLTNYLRLRSRVVVKPKAFYRILD